MVAIALVLIATDRTERRREIIALCFIALPLAYGVSKHGAVFYSHPRPFVVMHVDPLLPHEPDNSFPSDHTLLAAGVAAVVFAFRRSWGAGLWLAAFAVGAARVTAHLHWTH